MIYKISKTIFTLIVIIAILWGFSDSYSSHTIDNIVHVVAIGIDKCIDGDDNMTISFQFVNISGGGEGSSGGEASTVVTSINSSTLNKAINLMNSYIGKELNFSHCKVIVFSEDFAKDGISTEVYTLINNEELRPSTNIIISTSDANSYLKQANPNIEKLVTNYYDTFELTSNFTGYSDDINIGRFYNNLFEPSTANTAILGRTFKKASNTDSSSQSNSGQSENQGQNASQAPQDSSNTVNTSSENGESGQSSGSNTSEKDSGGASLEISGKRGTQNVGIAVFKEDKYIGQLSEIDSICHLLVTNNVDSFVLSIPLENYPDNLIDLNVSSVRSSNIKVNTTSDSPQISVSVYCEAKILTVGKNSNYSNPEILTSLSKHAQRFLKQNIENYLIKTVQEFNSDIAGFSKYALINFPTVKDWENYNWLSKYSNSNFTVNVNIDVTSSLLFSGDQ